MSRIAKIMSKPDCDLNCFQNKVLLARQGNIDPMISRNMRIAQLLKSSSLKGTTIIGNISRVNNLGGREGQFGGLPQIPRNKF